MADRMSKKKTDIEVREIQRRPWPHVSPATLVALDEMVRRVLAQWASRRRSGSVADEAKRTK